MVCLVGVQTNQYPRAVDLARAFRAAGVDVIIGGFHVSGTIVLFHDPTPDIQEIYLRSLYEIGRHAPVERLLLTRHGAD